MHISQAHIAAMHGGRHDLIAHLGAASVGAVEFGECQKAILQRKLLKTR
jgi:hypothetical protein